MTSNIRKKDVLLATIFSIISSITLVINNGTYELSNIKNAFNKLDYTVLLTAFFMFIAFLSLIPKVKKRNIKWGIPFSIIVATFLLLCESYYKCNSWDMIFGSKSAILTSLLKGVGIATMAFFVFDVISKINIEVANEQLKEKKFLKKLLKYSIIMFICWMPYMIVMAPGAMNADTRDQIGQVLQREDMSWTINRIQREEGGMILNNHHPVFHTIILGIFIKIGQLIGSYFVGMELYCIIQSIILIIVLTYSILKMKSLGMPNGMAKIIYIFFTLFPLFPLWAMTTFKDIPFAIVLLMLTIRLYELFKYQEEFCTRKYIEIFIYVLLLMMFRNNGMYLIIALFPFAIMFFIKNKKNLIKITVTLLSCIILFKFVYTGIIFNAFGIKNGSIREMLSVPFQQTARYIKEHKNEVTEKEKEAIVKVLKGKNSSLEDIEENYVPDRSDKVKKMFNKNAEKQDLVNYFKIWLKEFTKHPESYIEAFLNLNFSWFTFDSNHDNIYYNGVIDANLLKYIPDLNGPEWLNNSKTCLRNIIKILNRIPGIGYLFEFSFYTWIYVIVIIIIIIMRKKFEVLLASIPIYANYLICFIGPVAYMRYVIPMVICLPFVIFITFAKEKNEESEMENKGEQDIWIK